MRGIVALDVPVEEEDELFGGLKHHFGNGEVYHEKLQRDMNCLMDEDFAKLIGD